MKQKLITEIEIPEGVKILSEGNKLIVKGEQGEISKDFKLGKIYFDLKSDKITLHNDSATKNDKRMMNTTAAHVKNMIKGVQEKFEYKVKICFGHFPFTVKQEGNKVIIKNFLGEKVNREVNIIPGAELDVGKEIITIKSVDKEIAGQTAANFETATKIRGRDRRTFQDGIYIINKNGKLM